MDLMMSRDLTENAQLEILNISTDKRSLRDKQEPYINNLVFESPMELRLYTVNDMLQFRIKDINETFASLKLAELPL